jgi:hypothetical protein
MAKYLALGALCLAALAAGADDKKAEKPEPGRKGDKWEYAELHYSLSRVGKAGKMGGGGFGGGGLGGPGGGGNVQPGPAAMVVATKVTVRWITADDETEAEGWDGLATKLKAPAAGKDAKAATHKVKLLNHLGREGWELVSTDGSVWTFKRKAAK